MFCVSQMYSQSNVQSIKCIVSVPLGDYLCFCWNHVTIKCNDFFRKWSQRTHSSKNNYENVHASQPISLWINSILRTVQYLPPDQQFSLLGTYQGFLEVCKSQHKVPCEYRIYNTLCLIITASNFLWLWYIYPWSEVHGSPDQKRRGALVEKTLCTTSSVSERSDMDSENYRVVIRSIW